MPYIANQEAENMIASARPGLYIYFAGVWEDRESFTDTPGECRYQLVGKILSVTPTVNKLFQSVPGNIEIELPTGERMMVFEPSLTKYSTLTSGGNTYKSVKRQISPVLEKSVLKACHLIDVPKYTCVLSSVSLLNPDILADKQQIVEHLEKFKVYQEKRRQWQIEHQEKLRKEALESQIREQALRAKLDNINLDDFFPKRN